MQIIDDILLCGSSVPSAPPPRPLERVATDVLIAELDRRFPALVIGTIDAAGQIASFISCTTHSAAAMLGSLIHHRAMEEILDRRT